MLKWPSPSPVEMIQQFVMNSSSCKTEMDHFSKVIMGNVIIGNAGKTKVKCLNWKYEWGVDSLFSPVTNAMTIMSTLLYNALVLPDALGFLKENIVQYCKNVLNLLRNGLWKFGCRYPPEVVDEYPFTLDELMEYSLSVIVSVGEAQSKYRHCI